jgi:serine/threonine-protein kinase
VSARFVGGQLLYITADGTLQAAPFDERHLTLNGPPTVIATGVRIAGTYAGADLAVSERGALYYVAGAAGLNSHLEWVARDGTSNPVDPAWQQNAQFQSFALSPDGSLVAIALFGQGFTSSDIWIKELPAGPLTRLTVDPGFDVDPVWSGDGRSVLFVSGRVENPFAVYRRQADGLGDDVLVVRSERAISAIDESRDGRWLVAQVTGGEASADIVFMEIGRDTVPRLLIATPSQEGGPALSPDGRWIAYVSSATGRPEVYIRPFPDVESGRWQVSLTGGINPRWSHSGATVFFTDPDGGTISAVSIQATPTFSRSAPQVVFRRRPESGLVLRLGYDVSLDDNHFLMVGRGATNTESQLVRIDDVLQELQAKQRR